jgi:hypothetical protein
MSRNCQHHWGFSPGSEAYPVYLGLERDKNLLLALNMQLIQGRMSWNLDQSLDFDDRPSI